MTTEVQGVSWSGQDIQSLCAQSHSAQLEEESRTPLAKWASEFGKLRISENSTSERMAMVVHLSQGRTSITT